MVKLQKLTDSFSREWKKKLAKMNTLLLALSAATLVSIANSAAVSPNFKPFIMKIRITATKSTCCSFLESFLVVLLQIRISKSHCFSNLKLCPKLSSFSRRLGAQVYDEMKRFPLFVAI